MEQVYRGLYSCQYQVYNTQTSSDWPSQDALLVDSSLSKQLSSHVKSYQVELSNLTYPQVMQSCWKHGGAFESLVLQPYAFFGVKELDLNLEAIHQLCRSSLLPKSDLLSLFSLPLEGLLLHSLIALFRASWFHSACQFSDTFILAFTITTGTEVRVVIVHVLLYHKEHLSWSL